MRITKLFIFLALAGCATAPQITREYGPPPSIENFEGPPSRMPSAQEPVTEAPAPVSKLAEKIVNSKTPDEIEKWITEAEKGYSALPDTEKLVANELFLMKAFKGFRAKFDATSRKLQVPIDVFFGRLTRIEFAKWSKTPALESYVSIYRSDDKTIINSEEDLMTFFGNALNGTMKVTEKILALKIDTYPTLTCMFGCDPKKLTHKFQASSKISAIAAQMTFVAAFSLKDLFKALPKIHEPLMTEKRFSRQQVQEMNRHRQLFALTATGEQFLARSFQLATRSAEYERADLENQKRVKNFGTPEFSSLSKDIENVTAKIDMAKAGGVSYLQIGNSNFAEVSFSLFYRSPPKSLQLFLEGDENRETAVKKWIDTFKTYLPQVRNATEVAVFMRKVRANWPGGVPFPLSSILNFDQN